MDTASNTPSSRRAAVIVFATSVAVGPAVGAALAIGSRNLVMGATIGGILALLFGGFAAFAMRVPPSGRRDATFADGSAATFGGGHAHGDSDGGGSDGGGGGGDAG